MKSNAEISINNIYRLDGRVLGKAIPFGLQHVWRCLWQISADSHRDCGGWLRDEPDGCSDSERNVHCGELPR